MNGRQELYAWLEIDGLRVCRDHVVGRGPRKGAIIPEHLAVITESGDLEWHPHVEGAVVPTVTVARDYD